MSPITQQTFLDRLRKLITDYLWDDKQKLVAYNKLKGNYDQGGLKLVDLRLKDLSLKVAWILRLIESDATWRASSYIGCFQ